MRIIGLRPSTKQLLGFAMGICALFGFVGGFIRQSAAALPAYVPYSQRPQIILDPGHGGLDGGAVGVNNTVEQGINLAISQKLAQLLRISGFEVILTRETEDSIHDPDVSGAAKQKRSDMYNRKAIIDQHPNALFVSIHQNKFQDPSCKGAQVFYSPNHPQSQDLAQGLQEQFRQLLQPENQRQIKAADEGLFLLHTAQVPAVLVECGFLSNPEECVALTQEAYQQQVAFVIYLSLLDFYS